MDERRRMSHDGTPRWLLSFAAAFFLFEIVVFAAMGDWLIALLPLPLFGWYVRRIANSSEER